MTKTMPTVEEIEVMARRCENVYQGDHPGDMKEAAEMLRTIAEHMRKREPVAWMPFTKLGYAIPHHAKLEEWNVQNSIMQRAWDEGFCGTFEDRLAELEWKIRPVYACIPDDAEDARRYRYIKSQMETGAIQTQLPLHRSVYWIGTYIDCDNVQNVSEAIDAAMKGEGHDH